MKYSENKIIINSDNQTISYIDQGQANAETIILIHGFPLNKTMWNNQIEELKENYRVIAYDIRGFGSSDIGSKDYSIELFVSDLISFMDKLQIKRAILCGFSMGGYIALNAIQNFHERFTSLLLCDTNCADDSPETKTKRIESIENIKEEGLDKYAEESMKKLFAPISFTKQIAEIGLIREMIVKTPQESIFKTLHALANRQETCTNLHKIKVPVLIMVGQQDKITPPDIARSMHEKIAESTISIIDNAGHLSNLENPDQFNSELRKFLNKTK
ncbi:MAG TPA: alpha/beta fold hydrolase [Bacteroidales bacterium]|nr:alpha/beta fold hydrolase [Bacteroidales bacterium]